jgi:hypothetical protein
VPLLVHGIAREAPEAAREDDGSPSYLTVADGPLVGLVSETPDEEALPTRANLLHHTQVLEHVTEHSTVLPMRFGVVVPDAEVLIADFLTPEREKLLATLDRLEGHVELRLRGAYDEAQVIRVVLDEDPRAARLRGRGGTDAKMELGERIVAGIERRRARDVAVVDAALGPHAAAATTVSVTQPLDAFSNSYLVSADGRDSFEAAVDRLGEQLAPVVKLELVGPVPPFSFADGTGDAWG